MRTEWEDEDLFQFIEYFMIMMKHKYYNRKCSKKRINKFTKLDRQRKTTHNNMLDRQASFRTYTERILLQSK